MADCVLTGSSCLVGFGRYRSGGFDCSVVGVAVALSVSLVVAYEHFEDVFFSVVAVVVVLVVLAVSLCTLN